MMAMTMNNYRVGSFSGSGHRTIMLHLFVGVGSKILREELLWGFLIIETQHNLYPESRKYSIYGLSAKIN